MKLFSLGATLVAGMFCLSTAPAHSPAANRNVDESASAKAELLAVHQAARRAHLNRDVDFNVAGMGTEFTTVHEGYIRVMSREDVRKQFTEYFRGTEFSAWDDLEPPVIRISPDGKMGWMIVPAWQLLTRTGAMHTFRRSVSASLPSKQGIASP